jgi:predicted patatin/cPLA2 family phospholipase
MQGPGKCALIVEGGAMRGVFAAGVLKAFTQRGFMPFDFCIGVSSGAFVLSTYLAGKPELALATFMNWAVAPEFLDLARFVRGGHLLDIDWIASQVKQKLQLAEGVSQFPVPLDVCLTQVSDGLPLYRTATSENLYELLRATVSMPLLYRGFPLVSGVACTDGGVADPIPVQHAIARGASHIVVVRSREYHHRKTDSLGHRLIRWKLREHSALVQAMQERVPRHRRTVHLMRNPPDGVRISEICPSGNFSLGRFGTNRQALLDGFEHGLFRGDAALKYLTAPAKASPARRWLQLESESMRKVVGDH